MAQILNMRYLAVAGVSISGLALTACSSHHSGTRYATAHATAGCYAECGVRWVNRVVAIPTTHTIETKYVQQAPTVEYVDREVVKEVIKEVVVEKEVYVDRPISTPCPTITYEQPHAEYIPPAQPPAQDCYPQPTTPWTPPPVIRK